MPEITVGFAETTDPFGPYGAKGIAECPNISVAPAVTNAICNACGVRIDDIPATPMKMRRKMAALKKDPREGEPLGVRRRKESQRALEPEIPSSFPRRIVGTREKTFLDRIDRIAGPHLMRGPAMHPLRGKGDLRAPNRGFLVPTLRRGNA